MPGGNLADRLAALSASATGDDGVVTVTVAGSGVVTELQLDDRAQRLSAATLSNEILRTMRRAQASLNQEVAVTVEETVGADTEVGRAMLDTLIRAEPEQPAMPVMPFPSFQNVPTLPQQAPGNGFESGRDSRAR
ncbi:YbaB/EbfC family nucleoid-associated protein [Actinoplanes sp. NPDC026619]|uniref:YbaB/EbfC family nucleoid-associated protein n=1 Tax=Actinoplanes sp. NPDC026619 TaxID=3155798 RepID=UPI0033DCCFD6